MPTPTPDRASWAGSIARYGGVSSYGVWKVAIDAYYWDKVEQALEMATELGTAQSWQEWFYRLIEAEAVTRGISSTDHLEDLVSVEYVPHQLHHVHQVTADVAQATADVRDTIWVGRRREDLGFRAAEETDAPWTVGRAGYMMDKYPYDKICVPLNSTHDSASFQSVIRHEYAHVMVLNLSAGKATTYLHESVTMVAQDWPRREDWAKFASGLEPWLAPQALTNAFDDQHDPNLFHARSLAYSQTSALGYYLKSLAGEPMIGDLLRAFGDNSKWNELKMNLTGQTAADEALRQVYGFGEKDLFTQALEWLKTETRTSR